ncbi:hypothetical protein [Hymenobacter cellulosilyticus]|uniref:Uncharacterized protein n=1 Tax=Hymenobacter cellulosilyticus TaxID=2932248 RepID=A0A8T9QD36_9BACT|nr:hypothetical protein [Hymenobacter cellulosilyticus]UOQ73750.1 hypothetical protein MUN79_07480 [Hymenobacter cellulosilyticus]
MSTATELAELAAWENRVQVEVGKLSGSIEDKSFALNNSPLAEQYLLIHAAYTRLASHSQEALKRAIFIQWYWTAEPSIYSGIHDLSDSAVDQALLLLEQRLQTNDLDQEWDWMLPWCYSILEFMFERVENQPRFQQILAAYSVNDWQAEPVLQPLEQRGIMGEYWLSMMD